MAISNKDGRIDMRDFIELGPTPCDEACAQVGDVNYAERAGQECKAYRDLVRSVLGREPLGARLGVKWFQHDFGVYAEVVCWYEDTDPVAVGYALRCESEAPTRWGQNTPATKATIPGRIDRPLSTSLKGRR